MFSIYTGILDNLLKMKVLEDLSESRLVALVVVAANCKCQLQPHASMRKQQYQL